MHPNLQKASIFLHSTLKDTLFTHASDGCFITVCLRAFYPLSTWISEEKDSVDAGETWHHPEVAAQEDMQTLSRKKSENRRLPRLLSSEFWYYQVFLKGYGEMLLQMNQDPVSGEGLGGVSGKCHRCGGEWRTKEKPSHSKCDPSRQKDDSDPIKFAIEEKSKEVSRDWNILKKKFTCQEYEERSFQKHSLPREET